jgi:glycosyltransferase involved in cell wall biosynthesis
MSLDSINVLHIVLSVRPGGRRNAIVALARQLRSSIGRCDLCCLDELGCDAEEVAPYFDSVTVLARRGNGHLEAARRLRALCRDRDIHLIHTHDAASQFTAALVRLVRPHIKLMMTFHRSLGFESARRRDRIRNAFAGWLSGAIVTASSERREHFRYENTVANGKLHTIPLGIDTHAYCRDPKRRSEIRSKLNLGPACVVVGAAGHFGPEKGIDVAVRGFEELRRRFPDLDVKLIVLGDGSEHQRSVIQRAIGPHSAGRVVLAGFQENVRDWYSAFDLFVHTPRMEAFGLVVIEAMAASLPVVATRVGGVPELVRHERTGLLCEPESPTAVAGSLARLVRSADLRDQYGASAVEVAGTEYSVSLSTERYLALYSRLVTGEARQPQTVVE